MSKFLFISVKPEFAHKIISKEKSIELRKNRPNVKPGDHIIIYSTVPDKKVIGFCKIDAVIEISPEKMWLEYFDKLAIDKERFEQYYINTDIAFGIQMSSVCKLENPISLDLIRKFIPDFSPPQTYRYISYFKALRFYKFVSAYF